MPDTPQPALTLLPAESPPPNAESEFTTDFRKHSVPYSEILSGGPPKDGIPSIDAPKFQSTSEADQWLDDLEPVVFVQVNEEAKVYPIQILIWHEIVNDTVGGEPLMVLFCPLWILFWSYQAQHMLDIHIEVPRVDYDKLSSERVGESSESIRARIQSARDR